MPPTQSARTAAIVADLRAGLRDREVAERHGLTKQRVHAIRRRAGIPQPPRPESAPTPEPKPGPNRDPRHWREDDVAYLIAHRDDPVTDLAAHFGKSVSAIRWKFFDLVREGQLPRRPSRWDAPGTGPGTRLSAGEIELIDDPTIPPRDVAARTGRSVRAIHQLRGKRGVRAVRSRRRSWLLED
jgi:hypothetical protein